jgi:hypothetical protein
MKRVDSLLALTALLLFAGSSFAVQGRGQGRAGAPSTPVFAGNANLGDGNPGKGNAGLGNPDNVGTKANANSVGHQSANPNDGDSTWKIEGFKNYGQYVAAQHVSENLAIPFEQLKAKMTGPHAESLGKAIQELKGLPASAANAEAKKAEQAAKSEAKKN